MRRSIAFSIPMRCKRLGHAVAFDAPSILRSATRQEKPDGLPDVITAPLISFLAISLFDKALEIGGSAPWFQDGSSTGLAVDGDQGNGRRVQIVLLRFRRSYVLSVFVFRRRPVSTSKGRSGTRAFRRGKFKLVHPPSIIVRDTHGTPPMHKVARAGRLPGTLEFVEHGAEGFIAPVRASGWPMAIAPPSHHHAMVDVHRIHGSAVTTAAKKASFNSHRSISLAVIAAAIQRLLGGKFRAGQA